MDIYKLGSGQILAVITDESGTKARRFNVADIPGYPDDIPAATAWVEAQTIAGPEDLALALPSQAANPLLVLPMAGDLAGEMAGEVERLDLADLGQMVAAELAYLDTTIAGIDSYAAAQVRDVVKRGLQENRAILKALRFVVRRLA